MRLIKLIHPVHGVVSQCVLSYNQNESKVRTDWKYKYGKKFNECTVVIEGKEPDPINKIKSKPVLNIKTGEVYKSAREAALETGYQFQNIYRQCKRDHQIGYEYLFRYA